LVGRSPDTCHRNVPPSKDEDFTLMTRAAYIIKKDERYWFQKRFGAQSGIAPGLTSHCRVALRAADDRQAVSRMLKVMRMVQSYEIQADIVDRANTLLAEMQRFNATAGG
jgi:hypothetical protein